jgi:glycosyltransferase involved in cell wall biosynthesis
VVSEFNVPALRVLMLCNDRQIDRRILLQADSLEEAGWQVTILAMPVDDDVTEVDARVRRIGSQAKKLVRREGLVLAAYRIVRRYLPMNGSLMRLLKSFAWRLLVDHERFYLNLFLVDGRRFDSDVVVAHDLPMLAVGRTLAADFDARLVYDSHELYCEQEFSRGQQVSWAKVERRHIHACDRVITVNPAIAQELERRYGLPEVEVIYNAERVFPLGERSWYLHERFGISRDHPVLLFQGGLSAGRNLIELVEAMALLVASSIHLVILGDGQLSNTLQDVIFRRSLTARVHLHPAVPQADLLSITKSADAGIIPYQAICLNNLYCTPNKLFEFITAGLPILASDLPELRRLIVGNDVGQVFDLTESEQIADAISDFFSDGQRLGKWRSNLKVVREKLSWQHEGERLKGIYKALL